MLKPEDITTDDAKVIVAYAASAGTPLKSFTLDSSQFSRIFRGLVCTRL